jgi:hypothetical protein
MAFLQLLADVPIVPPHNPHSSSGPSLWLVIGVPVAVAAIGLGLLLMLRSRRRAHEQVTIGRQNPSGGDRVGEDERVP